LTFCINSIDLFGREQRFFLIFKGDVAEMKGKINPEENTITFVVPDFSETVGCLIEGQNEQLVHLGILFERITACGRTMGKVILGREVTINCPECVAEIRYRRQHPEERNRDFGVVTHKHPER